MDYSAEITAEKGAEEIEKVLKPEKISRERSSVSIKKEGKRITVSIKAKDAVALRASVNAVTQALAVHGKMKQVSEK